MKSQQKRKRGNDDYWDLPCDPLQFPSQRPTSTDHKFLPLHCPAVREVENHLQGDDRPHYDAENAKVSGAQGSADSPHSHGSREKAVVDNGREEI